MGNVKLRIPFMVFCLDFIGEKNEQVRTNQISLVILLAIGAIYPWVKSMTKLIQIRRV